MNDFEKSENAFDRLTDDRDEEKELESICDLYDRVAEFTSFSLKDFLKIRASGNFPEPAPLDDEPSERKKPKSPTRGLGFGKKESSHARRH